MAGKQAYGPDYTEDILELRSRGNTIAQAAAQLHISRSTAQRLLRAQRAAKARTNT